MPLPKWFPTLTRQDIFVACIAGIGLGLLLEGVIRVFGKWRFMPVLFVVVALIFILTEILWVNWHS